MWFGTEDGLNKFDGYDITAYMPVPEDPYSLSYNFVWSIYEDRSGVLWIGTNGGGLNKFDRSTERFIRYQNDPNDTHSLGDNFVRSICEDRFGALWIGTDGGGLNKLVQSNVEGHVLRRHSVGKGFDRDKAKFIRYRNDPNDPNSLSKNEVRSIYEDQSGILWISTYGGGLLKQIFKREIDADGKEQQHHPDFSQNFDFVNRLYQPQSVRPC